MSALTTSWYTLVTEKSHPGGVLCAKCKRSLMPGQPYQSKFSSMTSDQTPVMVVHCVYC